MCCLGIDACVSIILCAFVALKPHALENTAQRVTFGLECSAMLRITCQHSFPCPFAHELTRC